MNKYRHYDLCSARFKAFHITLPILLSVPIKYDFRSDARSYYSEKACFMLPPPPHPEKFDCVTRWRSKYLSIVSK